MAPLNVSTIPGSLVANQRGVPTVRQLIILFDAGTAPDVHIDTTRLLAQIPDWQECLYCLNKMAPVAGTHVEALLYPYHRPLPHTHDAEALFPESKGMQF